MDQKKISHDTLGNIELHLEGGKLEVYQNGKLCNTGKKSGDFVTPDGGRVAFKIIEAYTKDFPDLKLKNGETISLGNEMNKVHAVIACLPLALVSVGGLIGGALGGMAAAANLKVMRSAKSAPYKVAFSLTSGTLATIVWLVAAGFLNTSVEGLKYMDEISSLESKLKKDLCHKEHTEKLLETYNKAQQFKETIKLSSKYLKKCKRFSMVFWHRYEANTQLSRFKSALKDAKALTKAYPNDVDYIFWQAQTYQRMGKKKSAAKVYKKAIGMAPSSDVLTSHYVDLLAGMGEFCKAAEALTYFAKESALPSDHRAFSQAASWQKDQGCAH